MKYEYKNKSECKNKVSRIIFSMTTKEAESISSDLRDHLSKLGFISYPSEKFYKSVCEAITLYESDLVESKIR
jgi:hypothetical protein